MTNSHNAACTYILQVGIYRRLCGNGLVVSTGSFEPIRFRHAGLKAEDVVQASYGILEFVPKFGALIERFRNCRLNESEAMAFASRGFCSDTKLWSNPLSTRIHWPRHAGPRISPTIFELPSTALQSTSSEADFRTAAATGAEDFARSRLGLIPDHVFVLEFPSQVTARNRVFYFLEADRGTMPVTRRSLKQSSFHRKLVAYEATWKQKLHHSRFGFPRFRVLTVTTSAARSKNLAAMASRLGSGHGLFLFTDAEAFRAHPDPLSLLWETPQAGEGESLLGSSGLHRPGDTAKNVSA